MFEDRIERLFEANGYEIFIPRETRTRRSGGPLPGSAPDVTVEGSELMSLPTPSARISLWTIGIKSKRRGTHQHDSFEAQLRWQKR